MSGEIWGEYGFWENGGGFRLMLFGDSIVLGRGLVRGH
jgi:hypothetical protein